ncbi:hypothetical protein K7432_004383 [Basidiobolus ranarum]|uniref:Inhibitor I9 domain-containing protein n=1 Tax=Basidiobolus ranarum TaxID=34480 RepID=A0ABR2WYA3_9FUNG
MRLNYHSYLLFLLLFISISWSLVSGDISKAYIVEFKEDTPQKYIDELVAGVVQSGGLIRYRYQTVLRGFSAELTADQLYNLSKVPEISSISPVRLYHLTTPGLNPTALESKSLK